MKNKSILLASLFFLCGLAGCKKKEKFTPIDIEAALTQSNKVDTKIEGVVYAKTSDGFFVADATGKIFVASNSEVAVGDKVQVSGSYRLTSGQPSIKDASVVVKSNNNDADVLTPESKGIAAINTLSAKAKDGYYGAYYKVLGTIIESGDTDKTYTLVADESTEEAPILVNFADNSNEAVLADYAECRVEIPVLLNSYNEKWSVVFAGEASDVTDKTITWEAAKGLVKDHIEEVLGYDSETGLCAEVFNSPKFTLPTAHNQWKKISYLNWKAQEVTLDGENYVEVPGSNGGIVITNDTNGVLTSVVVNEPDEDAIVKLSFTAKRTLRNGTVETAEFSYYLNNKKAVELTPKQLLEANYFYNFNKVVVKGVIIAKPQNQSGQSCGFVLGCTGDDAKYSVQVDVANNVFGLYEIGDTVTATGYYRLTTRPTICTIDEKGVASEAIVKGQEAKVENINYLERTNVTINSADSFKQFIEHYYEYAGKVVAFVNPTLVYTERSNGDSIDISYGSINNGTIGTYTSTVCFVVSRTDNQLGSSAWRYGITSTEAQFNGTIYCIPTYQAGLAICTIPNPGSASLAFSNVEDEIGYIVRSSAVDEVFDEEVELLTSVTVGVNEYAITWESSDPNIISAAGITNPQTDSNFVSKDVTLTGTYTIDEVEKTIEIVVTVRNAAGKQISQLTDNDNGQVLRVEGLVVGYQNTDSFSSAGAKRAGLIIMDEETGKLMYVNNVNQINGSIKDGYSDSFSTPIVPGCKVLIKGVFGINSPYPGTAETDADKLAQQNDLVKNRNYIDVEGGKIKVTETGVAIDFSKVAFEDNVIVVDSNDDIANLFKNDIAYGKIIKFVATTDNPLVFQSNGSEFFTDVGSGKSNSGLRFRFNEKPSSSTKYTHNFSYNDKAMNSDKQCIIPVMGTDTLYRLGNDLAPKGLDGNHFFTQLGFGVLTEVGKIGTTEGKSAGSGYANDKAVASTAEQKCIGEFYCTVGYVGNSNYYLNILDIAEQFDMRLANASDCNLINDESIVVGEDVALIAKWNEQNIVWTSNKPEVLANNGTHVATEIDEETIVTFTGKVTVDGFEYTLTHDVTVKLPVVNTVTEVVAMNKDDTIAFVEGTYIGMTGATSASSKESKGIIISDGNNLVYVKAGGDLVANSTSGKFMIGNNVLNVGDKIKLSKLTVDTKGSIIAATDNTKVVKTGTIDTSGTWFNLSSSAYTTVTNETELNDAINNDPVATGASKSTFAIYKLTGDWYINRKISKTYEYRFGFNSVSTSFITNSTSKTEGYKYIHVNTIGTDTIDLSSISTASQNSKVTGDLYVVYYYLGSATFPHPTFGVIGVGATVTQAAA